MTASPEQSPAIHRRSWLEPRSLAGTIALFVGGYLLFQPFIAATLPRLIGGARLDGPAAWRTFVLTLPLIGAAAGSLWWLGGRRPPGRLRYWLRGTARGFGMATIMVSPRAGTESVAILFGVIAITAVVMGLLFGWMERWA